MRIRLTDVDAMCVYDAYENGDTITITEDPHDLEEYLCAKNYGYRKEWAGKWYEIVDEEDATTSGGWLPLTDLGVLRRGMVVRQGTTVLLVSRDAPDGEGDVWCVDVTTIAQRFIYAKDYADNYEYLNVSVHVALLELFSKGT